MEISIQVFSDIHIEHSNQLPTIPVLSKYLFLAGDICQITHPLFFEFLDDCSRKWKKVFYVLGNHEFHINGKTIDELLYTYETQINNRYNNIHLLKNSSVELEEGICVYGSTFWTPHTFKTTYEAQMGVMDYNFITYKDTTNGKNLPLNIEYSKMLSQKDFSDLNKYLSETNKKTILLTHFPVHYSSTTNPEYHTNNNMRNYYAWPDETLNNIDVSGVCAWISGHTHWSHDLIQNNVRLISNQYGYKLFETNKTGFNGEGVYSVKI